MKQSLLHTVFKQTGKQALLVAFAMLISMQATKAATPQCNQVVCADIVKANKAITEKLCAGDINVRGDLVVSGSLIIDGDLVISGSSKITADTINVRNANIDTARIKVEGVEVSYTTTEIVQDFHQFESSRFLTPNYDRFPDGVLPATHKAGPGTIYEFTSLNPLVVNETGDTWTDIVHGFIDFESTSTTALYGTPKDRLNYYSGAVRRVYQLMIDRPFSANEELIKIGYALNLGPLTFGEVMPLDQQVLAAQAMTILRMGLEAIDPLDLSPTDRVVLFNNITLAKYYADAWTGIPLDSTNPLSARIGTTYTNNLGAEYFGSPNPYNWGNYYYSAAYYPPFLNLTLLVAYGINTDPGYLLPFARALPIMFRLYPLVLQNQIDTALSGMPLGFYPHVLRSRPYSSKGESTFGSPDPRYGYDAQTIALVQNDQLLPQNDPRTFAEMDFNDLAETDYDQQLEEDVIFAGRFTWEGLNPLPLLELLVSSSVMTQLEADFIEEECRKLYPAAQGALLNFLNTFYLDPNSPFVRSLRMTEFDDNPGEWGNKFLVNENGNVLGEVTSGPLDGVTVVIDPLGVNVVITDTAGTPVPVSLQDIELQRDAAFGDEHYLQMAEIVLNLNRDSGIPVFIKTGSNPNPVTPFENWTTIIDSSTSTNLVEKLHESGVGLIEFFVEGVDFYLDKWVTATFPPNTTWQQVFPTRDAAIKAISASEVYLGDLEDPTGGGTYAFIQHYKPREDVNGPLYNIADIEAFYNNVPWDSAPPQPVAILDPSKVTIVRDRDNNIIYDPSVIDPMTGYIDVTKLFAVSELDTDKADYYSNLGSTEIAQGKAARIYYFSYDYVIHSYEDWLSGGNDPVLGQYFSPYIQSVFEKTMGFTWGNDGFASGSNYDQQTGVLTYQGSVNFNDPHTQSFPGDRSTYLHEFIMGHALQQPLGALRNAEGLNSWIAEAFGNPVTAEGWAVFIELFFGPSFTTYLAQTDRYGNVISTCGDLDPKVAVAAYVGASRVAARLKWDTGLHYSKYNVTMADYIKGFKADTFDAFDANSEISQRIPVGPTQGLNYALGFLLLIGLYESLPDLIGNEKYCELQNNGNLVTRYFFDTILLDAQGYFTSSLDPVVEALAEEIKLGIPPFNDPNYQGYPVDAFQFNTTDYQGDNPAGYTPANNPYVPGGFDFVFAPTAIPCNIPPCT